VSTNGLSYLDLIGPDGARNEAAFAAILARRIATETERALCVAAGLCTPRDLAQRDVQAWRHNRAAGLEPSLVSPAERNRIAARETSALEDWVRGMQRGATAQRAAMEALIGAE